MTESDTASDWRRQGMCVKAAEESPLFALAWADREDANAKEARLICKTKCPVRLECLVDALRYPDAEGLRGGFFFEQGTVRVKDKRDIEDEFSVRARTSQKQKIIEW